MSDEYREYYKWEKVYEIGIPAIDDDHKKLVRLLNTAWSCTDFKLEREWEEKILDDLIIYTTVHFKTEEDMMARPEYPDTYKMKHRYEHSLFITKVRYFMYKLTQGKQQYFLPELIAFIHSWLVNHIQKIDRGLLIIE